MLCNQCKNIGAMPCGNCRRYACFGHGTKVGEHWVCTQCLRAMPQAVVRRLAGECEPRKPMATLAELPAVMRLRGEAGRWAGWEYLKVRLTTN